MLYLVPVIWQNAFSIFPQLLKLHQRHSLSAYLKFELLVFLYGCSQIEFVEDKGGYLS